MTLNDLRKKGNICLLVNNTDHELRYVITSNDAFNKFYLYETTDGKTFKKTKTNTIPVFKETHPERF